MVNTVLLLPCDFPPLSGDFKILGLTVLDRIFLPARKSGFNQFSISCPNKGIENPAGRMQIEEGSKNFSLPEADLQEEFLVLSSQTLFSLAAWEAFSQFQPEPETVYPVQGVESCFLARTKKKELILKILDESRSSADMMDRLKSHYALKNFFMKKKDYVSFKSGEEIRWVERWLLQGLVKETEGFMSKHFERKISLFITENVIHTSLTPNQMTIISTLVGIFGAFYFILPHPWQHGLGALLFWLHSVLDGCDGEIARLKFLQSKWGGILDFWSDNVVHSLVFSCIAYGMIRNQGLGYPVFLGVAAVAGTLLSAGFVYWSTMRSKKGVGPLFESVVSSGAGGGKSRPEGHAVRIEKVADYLARRDFIYLVIVLAFLGKAHFFLWMGAVGAPVYFLVLLYISLRCHPEP